MNYTHTFIGIDPGVGGAIAILKEGSVQLFDTPVLNLTVGKKKKNVIDSRQAMKLLRNYTNSGAKAFIEDVWSSPQMGVTSSFSMGYGLGLWHGIITCNYIPMERIRPQEWKKEFHLVGKDKNDSIHRAKELFPSADIYLKKHHGRAEALLIAEFGRRAHVQNYLP